MKVKVFYHDGKVQEFPYAKITWEWDENEEGCDSGWRIHAIDKNYTTVSALVYPRDCTKIEITHEVIDMIFRSSPCENTISGKRFRIFAEIDRERKQQDEKWGEQNHPMVRDDFNFKEAGTILKHMRFENDLENDFGEKTWLNIIGEELAEAVLATSLQEQRKEMVQVAAVAVQIIEYLDRRENETKNNT
jgi:hypothetical protein